MSERPTAENDVLPEWLDDALCDALAALRNGSYDGMTAEEHLLHLIQRVRVIPPANGDEA